EMGEQAVLASVDADARVRLLERFTEHYQYDRVGNLVRVIDHLDRNRDTEYDALNRVVTLTEGAGSLVRTTTYRYDGDDNLVKTEFTYDGEGNLRTRSSAFGLDEERTETFYYDALGRLVEQINGESEHTTFAYDGDGNRVKITVAPLLAEERNNRFEYDDGGR